MESGVKRGREKLGKELLRERGSSSQKPAPIVICATSASGIRVKGAEAKVKVGKE